MRSRYTRTDAKQIETTTKALIQQSDALEQQYTKAFKTFQIALSETKELILYAKLRALPIEAMRKYESQIPYAILHRHGYNNILSLYKSTNHDLLQIYSIGGGAVTKINNALTAVVADAIVLQNEESQRELDMSSPYTRKLIQKTVCVIQTSRISKERRVHKQEHQKIVEALQVVKANRKLFGNTQALDTALDYLISPAISEYSNTIIQLQKKMDAARSITETDAWTWYQQNKDTVARILEQHGYICKTETPKNQRVRKPHVREKSIYKETRTINGRSTTTVTHIIRYDDGTTQTFVEDGVHTLPSVCKMEIGDYNKAVDKGNEPVENEYHPITENPHTKTPPSGDKDLNRCVTILVALTLMGFVGCIAVPALVPLISTFSVGALLIMFFAIALSKTSSHLSSGPVKHMPRHKISASDIEDAQSRREYTLRFNAKIDAMVTKGTVMSVSQFSSLRTQGAFRMPGCYVLHNKTKEMYYVGQAHCLADRVPQHFKGNGCQELYADYNRGDKVTVTLIGLEKSGYKNLNRMERDLIARYNACDAGYNKTHGNHD